MPFVIIKNGRNVEYREGFLNTRGIEIICETGLTTEEKRMFKDRILTERDVSAWFFDKTFTIVEFLLSN